MGLYEYWRILVRFSPILLLTSIIGISGATYLNFVTVPTYNASADVFVTTPSVSLDVGSLATGSNFTEQRVVSYAQIISGPATLGPVIKQLGLDVTPSELANDVHASAPTGTVLIRIDVTSKDPNKPLPIREQISR
jgi:polysaccharide biosynthesis transport protein